MGHTVQVCRETEHQGALQVLLYVISFSLIIIKMTLSFVTPNSSKCGPLIRKKIISLLNFKLY